METSETTRPFAVLPGEGEAIWFSQNRMTMKATAEQTGGVFGLLESTVAAGASPPLHVHHDEDESFYVLAGRVRFVAGDTEVEGGPGTFVFLPRRIPHTFVVEGAEDARILTLLTPGGGEGFFRAGGRPAEGPGLPPFAPPDVPRLVEAGARFGAEILGPPLQPRDRG